MPRTKTISPKSTKTEILSAYDELIAELNQQTPSQSSTTTLKPKSSNDILTDMSGLKIKVNSTITQLTDELNTKNDELSTLLNQIDQAKKELEEVQQIRVQAQTLQSIIELQEKQKQEFDNEMRENRLSWEQEQKQRDQQHKLEEESYQMQLKHKRHQEQLGYQEEIDLKRREFEQDLNKRLEAVAKREETVKVFETELNDLRKQSLAFPKQLEDTVAKAVANTKIEIEKNAEIEMKLFKQQVTGEKQVLELTIENLTARVKLLETENKQLKDDLGLATRHVKDIAVKVIEGQSPRTPEDRREKREE